MPVVAGAPSVERFGLLLIVVALVAIFARRLRIPYPIALVLSGILLGFAPVGGDFSLSRDLVFKLLLPPLVFEAAFRLHWPALRRELPPILMLAIPGTLLSAGILFEVLRLIPGASLVSAAIIASALCATDPVVVLAMLRDLTQGGRLKLLLESESLVNDGVAMALFGIAVVGVGSPGQATLDFFRIFLGGAALGAVVGGVGAFVIGREEDRLVELVVSTIVAYGGFLAADRLGLSGIMATIASGLVLANVGRLASAAEDKLRPLIDFWDFAAFLANSILFLLMGIVFSRLPVAGQVAAIGVGIAASLLARLGTVLPIYAALSKTSWRLTRSEGLGLYWGGFRGALAVALVLTLPAGFPQRQMIVATTLGVVAFSILGQGLIAGPILRKAA